MRKSIITATVISLAATGGCVELATLVALQLGELPELDVAPEIAYVEAHPAMFAQDDEKPQGTADIGALDGCWGAYEEPENVHVGVLSVNAEYYGIDLTANTMVYQVVQRYRGFPYPMDVFDEIRYDLEIVPPHTILATRTGGRSAYVSPEFSFPLEESSIPEGERETVTLRVVIDDSSFRFRNEADASPDLSGPHRADLVFRRLDCSVIGDEEVE